MSRLTADFLLEHVLAKERFAVSRAISLVENTLPSRRVEARRLLKLLLHASRSKAPAVRVGISGPPGVGKSTFIDALGSYILNNDATVDLSVLAVDPSSARSGGSILGDKTRMARLSHHPRAYVRPSPSAGSLGGVTRTTAEVMTIVEAAGSNVVLVETVGVGQSEIAVDNLVDTFVLLCLPAGGDELQGMKKGVVELADIIVVNKSDGDMQAVAKRTRNEYASALRLLRPKIPDWQPIVVNCSARDESGLDLVWSQVLRHRQTLIDAQQLQERRRSQVVSHLWTEIESQLHDRLYSNPDIAALVHQLEAQVVGCEISAGEAADRIVEAFVHQK